MLRLSLFSVVIAAIGVETTPLKAQSNWRLYEETSIRGTVSGTIRQGHIFRTLSRHVYEVAEYVYLYVYEYAPSVTVLTDGALYRLAIEGFDETLLARCLNCSTRTTGPSNVNVIESRLDGESEGFDGETVFKLRNGQIWLQTDGYYRYQYQYAPEVLIYQSKDGWKLRLEGIDQAVTVRRLRVGTQSVSEQSQVAPSANVIESHIVSDFDGLEYGNIYRLANGQIWEQTESWIWIWIWVNPAVLIWNDGGVYKMKVENIQHAVTVQRIR